jgi:hypothetical protein
MTIILHLLLEADWTVAGPDVNRSGFAGNGIHVFGAVR